LQFPICIAGRGLASFENDHLPSTGDQENAMSKVKKNVKGILNQRVRVGFWSVPLWVAGAMFVARTIRNRRRPYVNVNV
jgi:hypothetical protein